MGFSSSKTHRVAGLFLEKESSPVAQKIVHFAESRAFCLPNPLSVKDLKIFTACLLI